MLNEDEGTAQRALFIIDPRGVVRGMTINDIDVGRSVDETLRIIDALKFKHEFGEGCPVDWKKGEKGIDVGLKNRNEGPIELKKSWSEWARPKFQRAWSGTSQISNSSALSTTPPRSDAYGMLRRPVSMNSASDAGLLSGQCSPLPNLSASALTTGLILNETHSDDTVTQQRLDNMQASAMNRDLTREGVGMIASP